MSIKTKETATEFFIVYGIDTIKIYKEPPRNRGDGVDINTLNECELFSRQK
jgi:hypothetical protein